MSDVDHIRKPRAIEELGHPSSSRKVTTEKALYSIDIRPQNSLSNKARERIISFFLVVLGLGALRTAFIGAWPVMAFLLLDLGLIWLAFSILKVHMQLVENVSLTATRLIIKRVHPRRGIESLAIEPYWATISVKDRDSSAGGITISHHDNRMTVAHFLTDQERHKLAEDINNALQRWRAGSL